MVIDILRYVFLAPLELIFEVIFTIAFKATHSEGISIIILSLVVCTLVLPLYKRAERLEQEQRAKDKELAYWTEHIKKHFKGDEKYMMLDTYYRENNYNPLSRLKSSISILLQIPFFMAAYDLLGVRASARFNGVFFPICRDLGSPDGLLSLGGIRVNVLPILMTLISIVAAYIYTKDLPPKTALRSLILPLLFLVFLYNSPAALLLYWTVNNLYSLIKTLIITNSETGSKQKKKIKSRRESAFCSFLDHEPKMHAFILPMAFLLVLTGLLIPLAYLSASPEEFINITNPQNPLCYLISPFFVSVGFFIIWPSVFYFLASKKAKNAITIVMIGVSVFSAADYLLFGSDTGTINTTLVFEHDPSYPLSLKIINILMIIAVLAVCVYLYRFKKIMNIAFIAAILTTLTVSFINAKNVQDTYSSVMAHIDDFREDEAPQIRLSTTGENVMVIMLDRAVSGYLPYIFYEFPELEEQFDGFVYYPNCMSMGQNTLKASSALCGGYEYTPFNMDARADETLAEKHDEALKVLPKLFSEQGYVITLMDLPFPGWSWNDDYSAFYEIDNCYTYHAKDYFTEDTESNINAENRRNRNLFMYSLFKCAPLCLQEVIYDDGNYLSVTKDNFNIIDVLENYRVLENLDEMTRINNDYQGGLFIIDNETTHDVENLSDFDPYTPQKFEEAYYISNGVEELCISKDYQDSTYGCTVAAIRALGDYMDYLKEIGVYDNTRIIIVSDHGTQVSLFDNLIFSDIDAEWYNSLLMVKDFDSTGLSTDYTYMTNADVPVIALEGIIEDPVNPYTGNPIDSDQKSEDIYVGYCPIEDETFWNPDFNQGNTFKYSDDTIWFRVISGDIYNADNWVQTDKPD